MSASSHPILAAAATMQVAVKSVADVQPVFMTPDQKATALVELTRLESQVAGLRLRIIAGAADVAEADGMRDVASWVAHHTLTPVEHARADAWLAGRLDTTYGGVADALASGDVTLGQARVVVDALDDLPTDLPATVLVEAEETLIGYAERFHPKDLRRLGRRILDLVAPDIADAEEARKLAVLEAHARKACSIRFRALGDGTTRLSGLLPDAAADRLVTYLDAFTSPRHADREVNSTHRPTSNGTEVDRIPFHKRRGQAFCALLEHLDTAALPDHGGDATTVIVTMTLDALRNQLATAQVVGADTITASEARRLACTAQLVPAVLGGTSEVLDLGRAQRLFSPAQRKALRLRDQTCRADGCTIPAAWTEAHHLRPWSEGGRTDLGDGVLLCAYHHHRIHDPGYDHTRLASGDIRFHRRR